METASLSPRTAWTREGMGLLVVWKPGLLELSASDASQCFPTDHPPGTPLGTCCKEKAQGRRPAFQPVAPKKCLGCRAMSSKSESNWEGLPETRSEGSPSQKEWPEAGTTSPPGSPAPAQNAV